MTSEERVKWKGWKTNLHDSPRGVVSPASDPCVPGVLPQGL